MEEKRIARRNRVLKAGTVEFGGGAIDCTVRNVSETGAAIEVVSPLYIPDRFTPERFQAKWRPVRVKKMRQIKNLEPRFDSIETEKALVVQTEKLKRHCRVVWRKEKRIGVTFD